MDHERVSFILVRSHQDGTALSAFELDRRMRLFEHWRSHGHRFNKRRWNDFEGLLWKGRHRYNQFGTQRLFRQSTN
jgi:hypothetical protein